ncbi:MAG: hypothetical protein COB04_09725 [Gammaproteobacteria bacterium]|nr:MAG: hypothetical protein COB04_09725 [Gammaproteobacteria bacterium]
MEFIGYLAAFFSTLFCGAAMYITFAEHPARIECGTQVAATVFGPSYRRAAIMQASLAILATITALAAWYFGQTVLWLLGAALIFAVIPVTFIVIMPTNKQLLSEHLSKDSHATQELLDTWGRLHSIRSLLSLLSSILFLYILSTK